MKKFTIAILVLAIVLLRASLVPAGSKTPAVLVNTAPTGFESSTAGSPTCTTGGDCQDTFTWNAITDYKVYGYLLEVTAHYLSPTGTIANCPDTVLKRTFEVPASSCTGSTCTDVVDLLNNVALTGYTVMSIDASVSAIIMPWWKSASWKSLSLPNGAASIVQESVNSCPTPQ